MKITICIVKLCRSVQNNLSVSGLNYPGSHPSASPWRSSQPKVEDDKNDEIQILEDSDEEVLLDDFDGQCCRTFPYNHSRLQSWAEGRKKKESDDMKDLENVQNTKIPTSCFDKSPGGDSIATTGGKYCYCCEVKLPPE